MYRAGADEGNGNGDGDRARTPNGNGAIGGPIRPAMRVYQAEPPKKRRRWVRVLVWTLVTILLLAVAAVGGAFVFLQNKIDTITEAATRQERDATTELAAQAPLPNQPAIFMILGYDARWGEKQSRSDTIMLVRLDPHRKAMSMLSFPRDLQVDVPGYGRESLNMAYQHGGYPLALQTMKNLTGLQINYLVPVNFRGFRQTVDKFGGAYVDVDRRYFNDRGGPGGYATINLQPGYRLLTGSQSLDYARYRHGDSDIYRTARQQAFVREFKRRVDGWNVTKNLFGLLNILEGNVKVLGPKGGKMDRDKMLRYVNLVRDLPRDNVISVRPEVTQDPTNANHVVFANEQTSLRDAVQQFASPDLDAVAQTIAQDVPGGKKPARKAPTYAKKGVLVDVRNGNGQEGSAANAAAALREAGWAQSTSVGEADNHEYYKTVVYYGPKRGSRDAAADLAQAFGDRDSTRPLTPAVRGLARDSVVRSQKADVVVVVGELFTGALTTPPPPKIPPKQAPKVTDAPADDVAAWRRAQREARMPLEMPTKLRAGAGLGHPERGEDYADHVAYKVNGKAASYMTYHLPPRYPPRAFGVQAVRWKNPPILDGPTAERVVKGRRYRIYSNGTHVHRIAWTSRGVTYWLSNTLTDEIPNSTMWAMATSFRPVPR